MAEDEELWPCEVRAQDEEDIIKILLKQIEATPRDIDEKWISEMCRQINNADSLDLFWRQIVIRGRSYGTGYSARNRKSGTVMSRNPLCYAFEAREFIYDIDPQEDKILSSGQGLLAMAVAKSWDESREVIREQLAKEQRKREEDVVVPEELGAFEEEVKISYFKESLKLYSVLSELTAKNGGNPRQYISQQIRLHEGAIIDHFLGLKMVADARERYKDNTNSSKPVTEKISRWTNAIDEQLLALGKIYVDAALAEKAYRGRMQDYARLGFKALAMVYQRTRSGEALRVMREVNRIQRYNLWQMARVAWKNAKALATAERVAEADDEFLVAKNLYLQCLQCLSRLERSKKRVNDEYRRLQADITSWGTSRTLASVAATTGG